jgi:hypothetical protein
MGQWQLPELLNMAPEIPSIAGTATGASEFADAGLAGT